MIFAVVLLLSWLLIGLISAAETAAIKPEGRWPKIRLFLSLALGQAMILFVPQCVAEAWGRDSFVALVRVWTQYYLLGWIAFPLIFLAWWGWNWLLMALVLKVGGKSSARSSFLSAGVLSVGFLTFLVSGVRGPESLEVAVKKNDRKAVKAFLDGPISQQEIDDAFESSAFYADPDIAVLLLDHGANLARKNSVGRSALDNALMRDDGALVNELVKRGALKDAGPPALHFAAREGEPALVKAMLENGLEVDDPTGLSNFTPLMDCMDNPKGAEIAGILLAHGADPNRLNHQASDFVMTPLDRATCTNRIDIVKVLLAHGARIDDRSRSNMTPLISASLYGNTEIARLLWSRGARVDLKDKFGRTAITATKDPKLQALLKSKPPKIDSHHP